jgi:chromosome segregation and condensation protein ScpB
VTTEKFLVTFDLQTLRDLPNLDLAIGIAGEETHAAQI